MVILKIKQNGDIKEIEKNKVDNIDNIPILHYWKEDEIQLLGYNEEKGCNENKYDLPPPIDEVLYFGDLYVVKVDSDNNIIDMTFDEFQKFYNVKFKGFFDITYTDDEEEDELSEHSSDRDFIDDDEVEDDDDDDDFDEKILDDDDDEETDEDSDEISFSVSDNDDEENDIEVVDDLQSSSEKKNESDIEIIDDLEL